ncbi:hypothetical protein L7815_012120 [Serratia marcescens]|uniref:hypothetical protein n=1 Tax=Serratia marcescens TaxID=615 RepID=UPI001EE698AF|nr:hypothetical protein [Serratia marcescens]MCG5374682.1 hypothetical protein [Serratia marcescens]
MDNKLSKPVSWADERGNLCTNTMKERGLDSKYHQDYEKYSTPIYSQEYVSALLAENERVASDLVARNGEIEGLGKRAAELEAEITNIVDSHAETVAELRAKLATPVRLPNKNDDEFWFDGVFQVAKFDRAVERAIRAAGFTVEGDE